MVKMTRRGLMRQTAAIVGAMICRGFGRERVAAGISEMRPSLGQAKSGSRGARFLDVHHHVLPPQYVNEVGGSAIGAPAGRENEPPWTVGSSIEVMDSLGIETAITSVSAPGLPLSDPKAVQRLTRTCNDFSKRMMADHPRRFGMFATLPLPDMDASLAEVRHAFEELSADGIVLYTNYHDVYLGRALFSPLMEELNRRKAVVFVHPTVCQCSLGLQPEIPRAILEFPP